MPTRIIQLIFFTCLCFCSLLSPAQQPKKYLFTRYGMANGLAAEQSYSVVQDSCGYVWIASDKGLQRYDGKHFISFNKMNAAYAGMPSIGVRSLYMDSKGRLWLLFYGNNAGIFNTRNFKYKGARISLPAEFKKNDMVKFQEDDDGRIHFSVHTYGVLTYNEQKNEFSAAYNVIKLHDGTLPQEITKMKNKNSYLVATRSGFEEFNATTGQWAARNSNNLLKNMNRIMIEEKAAGPGHLFIDKRGRVWCDFWLENKKEAGPQVCCYDPADDSWSTYKESVDIAAMAYHSIDGFLEQKNGTVWLYGTSLFASFNEATKRFEDVRNESLKLKEIDMETIYNLYEDKDANIWISGSNGLFMFNPGKQVFNNLANRNIKGETFKNSVDVVLQAQDGNIFTSTWGAGIFAYDSNLNVIPNPIVPVLTDNNGYSGWDMHQRKNGEIWIGKQGGSIDIYNPETKKRTPLKLAVFENKTVRQLAEDSSGNIWMGTQYGAVIKCTAANWRDTANAFKIVQRFTGRITKIVSDKKGFVWVGTDRYGLFKLNIADGSIAARYNDESAEGSSLQSMGANDIFLYNDSLVLIASGCLNVLNTKTNKIYFVNNGPDGNERNSLTSIVKDRQGYLWLAFSDGLLRMDFEKRIFISFDEEDGILNNHFQLNAATLLRDGRILLGTTTDFLAFDPKKISLPKRSATVNISGFSIADKQLLVDSLLQLKQITLPYYNNTFTIDLTTFDYQNEYTILYNMEGLDDSWQTAAQNRITFHRLPPGHYVFRAKAVSAYGDASEMIAEVNINIVPPFWNTWWFYGLVILSVVAIFYMIDRERLMRIKATQKLRTDIALNLHHDVNTGLNNINLLSEMARMKADHDITKSKALIEQISDRSNDMMIAMDDMLWVIDPANDNMEKILLRMAEFTDSLRNRHEAEIDIHTDEKVKELKMDMRLRHAFFLIYKSALRCMIQFSGARHTLVNIDLQKNILSLKMHCSAALNQADSNVIKCMDDMKQYAAAANAELDIQNEKAESSIVLIMPLQ